MDATITLTGHVGTEVETFTGEGWQISRFRMASTPRFRRGDTWVDGETTWISVRATNRLAEHVAASIHKGDPVVVMGKLRTHTWTDQDQNKQDRLVVEATAIGHDLSRGTTVFSKPERVNPNTVHDGPIVDHGQSDGAATDDIPTDLGDERYDPVTGEVLAEPVAV
ncbi:single-stranded DNA-binding protein [Aestuariimicrobium ganziense]|uniref:single-stranded DNA-binding protein n=1 Tax=Aestuariimicrobium ganziense TaxID=2773677 RepID=UPI001941B2A2|nr:single-stranded DNA-binding protein [Aestuariimicrobium ganziense]